MAASKIHLFKKSAIEAGTPEKYYMDPSENLFKIASYWKVVENDDHLTLLIKLLEIGDMAVVGITGGHILISVMKENRETGAARLADENDAMNEFEIELNPKYLKVGGGISKNSKQFGKSVMLFIPKLRPSKIHLLKKSAIDAGKPDNYYLDPSMRLMKMASEWSVAEDESYITVTIKHAGFGDQVFVTMEERYTINIEVAKENKKAAGFGIKAGMNLKIEMNNKFLSSKYLINIGVNSTKVIIPKDKDHNGVFHVGGITITY